MMASSEETVGSMMLATNELKLYLHPLVELCVACHQVGLVN